MAFDLRRALLAKEERESARLMDFEFRLRARTLRLLGERIGAPSSEMARLTASGEDDVVIEILSVDKPDRDIAKLFTEARSEARRALMAELGDPAPHNLG